MKNIQSLVASLAAFFCFVLLAACNTGAASVNKKVVKHDSRPHIIGAMKNVMHKGELFARIGIDTLADKEHLYGMGPVENLAGEILVWDGIGYKASVSTDTIMNITNTLVLKAPFFGYANIDEWQQMPIPDSISTIAQLEQYLDVQTTKKPRPYFFKIKAVVNSAKVHLMNLPPGTKVSSPEDARKGQTVYKINNQEVDLLGFFSKEHQTIFTHHDTWLHIHLLTADKKIMGHLDEMELKSGKVALSLPKD
jgi:acetolactate decarboxylase